MTDSFENLRQHNPVIIASRIAPLVADRFGFLLLYYTEKLGDYVLFVG